jgi:acyl dehydratase
MAARTLVVMLVKTRVATRARTPDLSTADDRTHPSMQEATPGAMPAATAENQTPPPTAASATRAWQTQATPGRTAVVTSNRIEEPMAKMIIEGLAGLKSQAGKELGRGEWKTMRFEDIVRFADATGDHQWIHVDRERAKKESPFGAPIAHGYFTLSLIAGLFMELLELRGFKLVINYGLNKVRFPSPLKEGARYRLALRLGELKDIPGGVEALLPATIEIDGEPKPACVAEVVYRFMA